MLTGTKETTTKEPIKAAIFLSSVMECTGTPTAAEWAHEETGATWAVGFGAASKRLRHKVVLKQWLTTMFGVEPGVAAVEIR